MQSIDLFKIIIVVKNIAYNIKKPMSSIKNFNTKVTIKSHKHWRCST